jgi:hypothetical protein
MHEIFFKEFPCMLHEWLKRQIDVNSVVLLVETIVWDQNKLDILKVIYNKCTQAIEFWFTRVKEGHIIEFSIEYSDSFNEVARKFKEGPIKRMLEEIPLWIKMLFMERIMMHMETERMAE